MKTTKFENTKYPTTLITLPFGDRRISSTNLNEKLLNADGSYVSEEARLIYETIFYFVEDEVLKLSENEISKIVLSEMV